MSIQEPPRGRLLSFLAPMARSDYAMPMDQTGTSTTMEEIENDGYSRERARMNASVWIPAYAGGLPRFVRLHSDGRTGPLR